MGVGGKFQVAPYYRKKKKKFQVAPLDRRFDRFE